MPQPLQQDNVLKCRLAWQWISYMHNGRELEAARMLASDCGLLGVQTTKHSSIFLPILQVKWLPRCQVLRIYSVDDTVSLHVALADRHSPTQLFRIYFRFCFAKITKVDLSALYDDYKLPFEQSQFELPLGEVIFYRR